MVLAVDVERADPQVILARAEGTLHAREALVGRHGGLCPEVLRRQARAHDVNAIQLRLGRDPLLPARPAQLLVGHHDLEMLAHLLAVQLAAQAAVDRVCCFPQ